MSLGKALGHSMATLTMSAGGGMAEVGRAGAVAPAASRLCQPLLEEAHAILQDKSDTEGKTRTVIRACLFSGKCLKVPFKNREY